MKKTIASLLLCAAPMMAFAGIEGVWVTEAGDTGTKAFVQFEKCGNAYCGTVIGNTEGTDGSVGLKIVWDMVTSDGANFTNGKITDPTRNKTYDSKMYLNGNNLKVSGCILGICRAQNWTRK